LTLSIREFNGSNIETADVGGIGQILKKARENVGYSIDDLAETTGLTSAEIAQVENETDVDEARLRRIAAALRFDLSHLGPR